MRGMAAESVAIRDCESDGFELRSVETSDVA